jgi:hypothetical protein
MGALGNSTTATIRHARSAGYISTDSIRGPGISGIAGVSLFGCEYGLRSGCFGHLCGGFG